MAVRIVKCKYCGIQFDRNAEPAVEVSARRYAHKACADKYQEKASQDELDYAELEKYIKTPVIRFLRHQLKITSFQMSCMTI